MATAVISVAAKLTSLATPTGTANLFILGFAILAGFGVLLLAELIYFAIIAVSAGRQTKFKSATTVEVNGNKYTFDEFKLVPLLTTLGAIIGATFQLFFSSALSTARGVAAFVLLNFRQFIGIFVLIGFILLYRSIGTSIYPITTQVWNCEFGAPIRTIILPFAAFIAFILSSGLPVQNFISRFSKTATTSAIFRAVIGSFAAVSVTLMLFGSALLQFNIAQTRWITQPTAPGQVAQFLVVGPDFNQTSHLVGDAIFNLRFVTDVACGPLQPYVFVPLLSPFDGEEFAAALNNTLNLFYVPWSQGILRPIAQYMVNLNANPSGTFGTLAPLPSFNSTIDTLNNAQRNWTRFADSFIPSLIDGINVLLRDVTGVPLPAVAFPRRGLFTLFPGAAFDLVLRTAKLTQNLVFQVVFNSDEAFKFPEGIAIWKVDEILDGVLEYTLVITDYTTFFANYLRALGDEFEATLTNPLEAEHHSIQSYVHTAFVPLATEGQVINTALKFVASIIDQLPCLITKTAEAIVALLKLINNLIVGTLYSFINSAFQGKVASPFAFAQSLFRPGPYTNIRCSVNSNILFTVDVLGPCPDYYDAVAACGEPVFNSLTMQYDFPRPTYPTWHRAPQGTINTVGAQCAAPMVNCLSRLILPDGTFLPSPSGTNQYDALLRKLMDPFVCIFDFIAKLCVGTACPFSSSTPIAIIPSLAEILVLPINLVVHTDRIVASSYIANANCFPIDKVGPNIQIIESALTNAVRRIINAINSGSSIAPCGDTTSSGAVASTFVPCCLLNLFDAAVGFAAQVAQQLTIQLQKLLLAFLPAISGGLGQSDYTPPTFFFSTNWLTVASDSLACLPVQIIPADRICDGLPDSVQSVAESTLSALVFEVIVFIPRIFVNGVNGLLNLILNPSANSFRNLFVDILSPIVDGFGNVSFKIGTMLQCVDSSNALSTTFFAISTFVSISLNTVLPIIVDVAVAAFQFVIGIIALFTGDVTIFFMAITSFFEMVALHVNEVVKAFAGIIIALFSQSLVCSITEAICAVSPLDNTPFVQACNEGLGTNPPNPFGFVFCNDRKRDETSVQNCFEYLANYGYDRSLQLLTAENDADRRAIACRAVVTNPSSIMHHLMTQQKAQNMIFDALLTAPETIQAHWEREGAKAREHVEQLYVQQKQHAQSITSVTRHVVPDRYEIDFAHFRREFTSTGDERTFRRTYQGHHEAHRYAKRALAEFPQHSSILVNFLMIWRHWRDVTVPSIKFRISNVPATHVSKRSVHEDEMGAIGVGLQLAARRFKHGITRSQNQFNEFVHSKLDMAASPRIERVESEAISVSRQIDQGVYSGSSIRYIDSRGHTSLASWYASGDLVAPLAVTIDDGLLPVVGLPQCDEMTQFICTDCKYLDDLIYVSEKSFNAAKRFYNTSTNERGTFGYIAAQLDRTLTDILVNPGGNDTYATEPRTVVFITTRIWNIRWGFDWDRSELLGIVTNTSVTCDFADPFADIELDQGYIDAFNKVLGNLVTFAEQVTCQFSAAPAEISMRVFERYVMCDYDEALYSLGNKGSASVDGPQQLVDGFANAALVNVLVGTVVDLIPGTSMTFMMASPIWLYFGTLWFGYGSSPFCTLPGPFQMFGAYPVNLPLDAYGVLESFLPPSLPFPFALIDPTVRDHFATVKITTCGDVPPEINCTFYGFTGIYDNIFFSTGVLFGDSFNSGAANSVGLFSDEARESAAKFTEAHIAELDANHNAGDVCNRQTFLTAFIGLIALAGQLFVDVASALIFVPFFIAVAVIMFIILLMINKIGDQVDEYYIEDKRLDSPKE